jgi:hypothetical protein
MEKKKKKKEKKKEVTERPLQHQMLSWEPRDSPNFWSRGKYEGNDNSSWHVASVDCLLFQGS